MKYDKLFRIIVGFKATLLVTILAYVLLDIRMGDDPAMAQENASQTEKATEQSEGVNTEDISDSHKSWLDQLINLPEIDSSDVKKEDISKFLALADRKKRQIEDRIEAIKLRAVQLDTLEKSIDLKLARIDEERRFISSQIQKEVTLKEDRLEKLVELYKKMSPKKAAPIFENLNKDLLVALTQRISQKQMTKVMEKMTPEKSKEITEYFGRIDSLKEYDLLKEMNTSLREEFDDCKGKPKETL